MKIHVHRKKFKQLFIVLLFITQTENNLNAFQQTDKIRDIHAKNTTTIKKKALWIHAITWINFKSINPSTKYRCKELLLYDILDKAKF